MKVNYSIQAAVLDEFVHESDLDQDPDGVQVVLSTLKKRDDLADYFFSRRPSASWAPLLLRDGFFDTPPGLELVDNGYRIPGWRLSRYLSDVASNVPDVVVQVVNRIETDNANVCADLVKALSRIPANQVVPILAKVIAWLDKNMVGWGFDTEVFDLIAYLAREGEIKGALRLFQALSEPVPFQPNISTAQAGAQALAQSKFEQTRPLERYWWGPVQILGAKAPQQLAEILESDLIKALELESTGRGKQNAFLDSWWRSAIEESTQDTIREYKDDLLISLRDLLVEWVRGGTEPALAFVRKLWKSDYAILQRLAIDVIRVNCHHFKSEVSEILTFAEILDDTRLHHEVFLLLRDCFSILDKQAQHSVLTNILAGPDPARTKELAESVHREYGKDVEEYAQRHDALWIRDRLWMIRDSLSHPESDQLAQMIGELGEPEHPEFLVWSSGAFFVQDQSPLSLEKLSRMSDDEILDYAQTWNPTDRFGSGPERLSHEGFAEKLAEFLLTHPDRSALVPQLAKLRPPYAFKFYHRLGELIKDGQSIQWREVLDLSDRIVANSSANEDQSEEYTSWRSVKVIMIDGFDQALGSDSQELDGDTLQRIRDLLLTLIYDPDPNEQADNPSEGWFGYGDPMTIALNHVRPRALMSLLEYALRRARMNRAQLAAKDGSPDSHWEPVVRDAVTAKLDRTKDASWSVHSVYGRFLPKLYFIDNAWLEEHLDQILPQGNGATDAQYFAAAWDSYVLNKVSANLFDLLRQKYVRAILNLAEGQVTRTHLDVTRHLAEHILSEYLTLDYELLSPPGDRNLLRLFMEHAPSKARGSAIWVLWQWFKDDKDFRKEKWTRARALWAWRTQEASVRGYPPDFDDEFTWFAHFPALAIDLESMQSLWPLLQGLLPYITRDKRGAGWMAIEEYLAKKVESDPVNVIKYYRLMHEQPAVPPWLFYGDEAEKIMRGALDAPEAREQAIELADLLARRKNFRFLELVKTYQGPN